VHPSGTIILVKPEQYNDAVASLVDHELHPFHVVITGDLEYLLAEVLQSMPCRRRPREKADSRIELCSATDSSAYVESKHIQHAIDDVDEEYDEWILCEKRTFLCFVSKPKGSGVVQSTADAVISSNRSNIGLDETAVLSYHQHFRGVNPRRFD